MHRFFADEDGRIRGDEYKHLTRVLRLSEGDEIEALLLRDWKKCPAMRRLAG